MRKRLRFFIYSADAYHSHPCDFPPPLSQTAACFQAESVSRTCERKRASRSCQARQRRALCPSGQSLRRKRRTRRRRSSRRRWSAPQSSSTTTTAIPLRRRAISASSSSPTSRNRTLSWQRCSPSSPSLCRFWRVRSARFCSGTSATSSGERKPGSQHL